MAEAGEVDKTARRERGAEPKRALTLLLFLALFTCHSSLLFGQRFSHIQGAAGHLSKNQRLATGGPYAYTRNPLYLGSAVMGLGGALAGRSWLIGGAFLVLFVLVYWPVMQRESRFLQKEFPRTFESYARQVPLFFPRLSPWRGEGERFEWRLYLRNREYEAAAGYAGVMVFLALRTWLS